jgi:hypothetical protein
MILRRRTFEERTMKHPATVPLSMRRELLANWLALLALLAIGIVC